MIIGCLKKIFGGNFRPQQGLTIMNLQTTYSVQQICELFPSPTGVNYYEYSDKNYYYSDYNGRFRPQQGLTIMNKCEYFNEDYPCKVSVPNRG